MITKLKIFKENVYAEKETFPSKEFADATGINWVYNDWEIPSNINIDQLGKDLRKWYNMTDSKDETIVNKGKTNILNTYKQIVELNPELKNIKTKTFYDLYNVILGVISKFNYDDIEFFVTSISDDFNSIIHYNKRKRPITDLIENKVDKLMGWVASPKTINKLLQELNIDTTFSIGYK